MSADLAGVPESIEVESLDLLNGTSYSVELAAGSYDAVASTCGFPPQEAVVNVPAGSETTLDIAF